MNFSHEFISSSKTSLQPNFFLGPRISPLKKVAAHQIGSAAEQNSRLFGCGFGQHLGRHPRTHGDRSEWGGDSKRSGGLLFGAWLRVDPKSAAWNLWGKRGKRRELSNITHVKTHGGHARYNLIGMKFWACIEVEPWQMFPSRGLAPNKQSVGDQPQGQAEHQA